MDKPKLLVIDDDRNLCESLTDILEAKGYLTDSAHTAEDGIKKTQGGFYNVILQDMKLPDANGIDTLEKIKDISPDTEVIIFTAFAETGSVIKAMERKAFSYIVKPYEIANLLDTVNKAYEKQELLLENRALFQKISDSKKDWENTFDAIQDMISIQDMEFNIVKCNKAVADTFHVKPGDLIGRKCYELFHCDKKPYDKCILRRCEETRKQETEEIDFLPLNGTIEITCFPRFDERGNMTGIVHVGKDITSKKKSEKEEEILREISAKLSVTLDPEEICEIISDCIGHIIPHNHLILTSVDSDTQTMIVLAVRDKEKNLNIKAGTQLSHKDMPTLYSACKSKEVVYTSFEEMRGKNVAFDNDILEREGIKRIVIVPLVVGGDVIGLFVLACRNVDTSFFREDARPVLQKIADILVGPISNALLLERISTSEKKYRELFETSTDGISFTDLEGNILDCNKGYIDMLGYSLEEIKTKRYQDITPAKWHDMEETIVREQLLKRGFSDLYEKEYIRKDGIVFPVTLRSWFQKDEKGNVKGKWGIARDITRLKSDEARILRQRNLLNAINTVFKEALTCETEEEVGSAFLAAAEELTGSMFGYVGEVNPETGLFDTIALSNPGWDACTIPETNAVKMISNMEIRGIDRTALSEEKSRIVNDPASHPDRVGAPEGHPPLTSFLGVLLKHGGKIFGMIGLANKESGYELADQEAVEALSVAFVEALMRKRADSALKRSEKRYASVSGMTSDYVYHINVNSGKQMTVDSITEGFTKSTGYTVDNIRNPEMWREIVPPDDISILMDTFRKIIMGDSGDFECRIITKKGEKQWLHVYGQPEWDDKQQIVTGIIGAVSNITEHKRFEKRILEESEINEILLSVSNIISTMKNRQELIENTLETVYKSLKGEYYSIALLDEDTRSFNTIGARGTEDSVTNILRTIRFQGPYVPLIERMMESKKSFAVTIDETDVKTREFMREIQARSMLIVPLVAVGMVAGFMLYYYASDRPSSGASSAFSRKEDAVIKGAARQLSLGIENARLYQELMNKTAVLENKVEVISVTRDIDRIILSTLEPVQIFETSTRLVSRIIPCDRVTIVMIDKERGGFVYTAGWGVKLEKGDFVSFEDTNTTEVVRTGRTIVRLNIAEESGLLSLDKSLLEQGFLSDIRLPLIIKGEVFGLLNIGSYRRAGFTPEHIFIATDIAAQISVAMSNANLINEVKELYFNMVKSLSAAIDAKSEWTKGHSDRVMDIAMSIGKEMGLETDDMEDLRFSAILHDIGKIGTYEHILDKPGNLTEDEQRIMQQHPAKGAEILKSIRQFKNIVPAVLHHHERFDGKGYPDGLKGKEVPLFARIIHVADSFDAMVSERPYRKGLRRELAMEEIRKFSGTQFDPEIGEVFLKIIDSYS